MQSNAVELKEVKVKRKGNKQQKQQATYFINYSMQDCVTRKQEEGFFKLMNELNYN